MPLSTNGVKDGEQSICSKIPNANALIESKKVFFDYFCHAHRQVMADLSHLKSEYDHFYQKKDSTFQNDSQTNSEKITVPSTLNVHPREHLKEVIHHLIYTIPESSQLCDNEPRTVSGTGIETDAEWADRMLSIPALSTLLLTSVPSSHSIQSNEQNSPSSTTRSSFWLKKTSMQHELSAYPVWWMWTKINRYALLSRASPHYRKSTPYKEIPLSTKSRTRKAVSADCTTCESESDTSILCRVPLISLVNPFLIPFARQEPVTKAVMSLEQFMYPNEISAFSRVIRTDSESDNNYIAIASTDNFPMMDFSFFE